MGSKRSIHLMRKTFHIFHIYSVVKNHKKNHTYLPVSQKIVHRLPTKYSDPQHLSLSRFIGYCKTSAIFWLIFSLSSPPSLATMRFSHSSSMNTSLGEFSKFPMSSISMQSSSSPTITFFSEELLFLTKP